MHHPRALVVDDEPDIRELLAITLGRMQLEVDTAGDYRGAVKRQFGGSATTSCSPTCACPTATGSTSSSGSRRTAPACRWR